MIFNLVMYQKSILKSLLSRPVISAVLGSSAKSQRNSMKDVPIAESKHLNFASGHLALATVWYPPTFRVSAPSVDVPTFGSQVLFSLGLS